MRAVRSACVLLAALVCVAACGDSGGGSSAQGTSASSSSPSASHSSASASAGGPGGNAGCPGVGRSIPSGAQTKQTIDVDRDGRPDTAWIATTPEPSGQPFGVRTASGAVLTATIHSASPVARSVLFADVTGRGEIIALASDGRQVLLYAVSQCQIIAEKNAQGQEYAFDLGFTGFGTGVGCADTTGDGVPDLLGLKLVVDAAGTPRTIERTVVELTGPQARNGATSTVSDPPAAQADQARSVTCGSVTMTANGVSSGP